MLKVNLIADTDSYKHGHASLINEGLTFQYSYGEARVKAKYDQTLYLGMNIILRDYFSQQITQEDLEEAIEVTTATHGFNPLDVDVWQRVIDECDGYLPIEIKSAPEGSLIPADNVLFTINSTKDWFAKSVQLLEPLLMHIWYTSSVATRCYYIYKHVLPYYIESGTTDLARFALHDFGFRGATRRESAIVAGMMQLFVFDGSDNMAASRHLRHYYEGAPLKGKSICATEHSVALSYGRGEGEKEYFRNAILKMAGQSFSIVIDTYDTYGFLKNVVNDKELKKMIMEYKGRIVLRPDSGDPIQTPLNVLSLLEEFFGSTPNDKGHKVINYNIGVIQGDGMDENSVPELYRRVVAMGFSADNIVTGSGGGLHQKDITRDTQRFAIKPSFGVINSQPFNFKKQPSTDVTKTSKSGRLKLHPSRNSFSTISSAENTEIIFNGYIDVLQTVYKDGEIFYCSWEDAIKRVNEVKSRLLV